MKPFFSIIIACCDVEPFVEECLRSVLDQPFRDWECLIGIEESKDRTEEIIRKLTAGDPRFRIFTGPRSGSCSTPRNTGIDMAEGEYVIFLDGDDTIAEGCLSHLHDMICERPGADLYPCALVTHNEIGETNEIRDNYQSDAPAEMNGVEATVYLGRQWQGTFCPMLQLSIYRRQFLLQNNLKCIPGLRFEDSEFSPRAIFLAERIVPLHVRFYFYRIHPNSISTMKKDASYFIDDWAIITRSLLLFYHTVSQKKDFDSRVIPHWILQWISRMNRMWFLPGPARSIPRAKRVETLEKIFADGFDIHRDMLKHSSKAQRIAGFWVRVFVRHPSLRGISELFFRFYFSLTRFNKSKNASRNGFCRKEKSQSA